MLRHLAVFLILLGVAYLAVRFGGISASLMLAVPAIFIIYLGVAMLLPKLKAKSRRRA